MCPRTLRTLCALDLLLALIALTWPGPVAAELSTRAVPEALKAWIPWVLEANPGRDCPSELGNASERSCLWPARLSLDLNEKGGRFSQGWRVFRKAFIALPGDEKHPPLALVVDGKKAVVAQQGERYGVWVEAGAHQLAGTFLWSKLPERISIPAATGLLELVVGGKAVPFPRREADGALYLAGTKASVQADEDRLELQVHRKVVDELPLAIETRLELKVSGNNREILVGPALLAETIPMRLRSPLPARLEADGRLRIQVRPGQWTLVLDARHKAKPEQLQRVSADPPWPKEEIWVFEARPSLRITEVSGADDVDPKQTRLPAQWQALPAYRVGANTKFKLGEVRRGDADPAPDQLNLKRSWWLDFDGGGFTVQDKISGLIHSGWRVQMRRPMQLGRVQVDGREQLITSLGKQGEQGVEVRRRQLNVIADSRLEQAPGRQNAVGWDHDFQSVSAQLVLPPGWRVFQVSGVDSVSPRSAVWMERWNLLDLFMLLILTLGMGKLYGKAWGALALLTLVLTMPEGGPVWSLASLLSFHALWKVLPEGWVRLLARLAQGVSLLVVLVTSAVFMVHQVRVGIYPALEHPNQTILGGYAGSSGGFAAADTFGEAAMPAAPPMPEFQEDEAPREKGLEEDKLDGSARVQQAPQKSENKRMKRKRAPGGSGSYAKLGSFSRGGSLLYQVDPAAAIQTGPGLPRWRWSSVSLNWSGPVARDQQLGFHLLSPTVNLVLSFLRVLLLAGLLLGLLLGLQGALPWRLLKTPPPTKKGKTQPEAASAGSADAGDPGPAATSGGAKGTALGLLLLLALLPARTVAQLPTPELLQELQERLLKAPACGEECALVEKLLVEASPDGLRLREQLSVTHASAIPLPGVASQWTPKTVTLDGHPATALRRDPSGHLWVFAEEGRHQLQLDGEMPRRSALQLSLPLHPMHTEVKAQNFAVDGVHDDGLADASIQLTRQRDKRTGAEAALEQGALPALVRVERSVHLGLDWTVRTQLTRLTPADTAVVLELPLLAGESPTTAGLRVESGRVQVNLPSGETHASWTSSLSPADTIRLEASQETAWVEVWKLDASPIWNVQQAGIPPVHTSASDSLRTFRPWPGETLELKVLRPAASPGKALTILRSRLLVKPGARVTDSTLQLWVRASRGKRHAITLPEGAVLQGVKVNGQEQPLRAEGRALLLPLHPGEQRFEINWRESTPIRGFFRNAKVDLGAASVNAELAVQPPERRWVLGAIGPLVGPAVLFWSLLLVVLLASLVLGRLELTPLRWHQWALLGVGLSQSSIWVAVLVGGFLLFTGWRAQRPELSRNLFNLRQLVMVGWAGVALVALLVAVGEGLLGTPDMQIAGNGSSRQMLNWFVDRSHGPLPQALVISVPLYVFRGLMLAWACWLAVALLRWFRFVWASFGMGGLWKRPERN